MTNSHNKSTNNNTSTGNGKSDRFFLNNSPQQAGHNHHQTQQYQQTSGNNKNRSSRVQKSPTSKYFNSISASSNPIPINRGHQHHHHAHHNNSNNQFSNGGGANHHRYDLNSHHHNSTNHGNSHSRSHNSFFMTSTNARSSPGGSCSPPNFSHFAGSKCYDAPTADNLPQPPIHWTKTSAQSCAAQVSARSKRFDDVSFNLKMLLNVQA